MGRILRIVFFTAFVAVVLGAAWTQYEVQRARADDSNEAARATRDAFQGVLTQAGRGDITTTLASADEAGAFWYAEDYHQQYLHKNPNGYCNHGPNGLTCPVGVANLPAQTEVAPPRA